MADRVRSAAARHVRRAAGGAERAVRRLAAKAGWHPAQAIRGGVGRGLRISLGHASADYVGGTNELPVQEALRDHIGPGDVFYDVGANVGFFSLVAARLVGPGGHVYAFEPVASIAESIRANAARNRFRNVTVLAVAVGSESGTAELLMSRHPGGATLSVADAPVDVAGSLRVPTVTIDELVTGGRILPPAVVKIDVEGAELDVIRGMARTIELYAPVLVCELDHATADGLREKIDRFRGVLDEHGYDATLLESSYQNVAWHVAHLVATPRRARTAP